MRPRPLDYAAPGPKLAPRRRGWAALSVVACGLACVCWGVLASGWGYDDVLHNRFVVLALSCAGLGHVFGILEFTRQAPSRAGAAVGLILNSLVVVLILIYITS